MFRADPDAKRFFAEVLVPAGLFYLDDEQFALARRRLTPEGMREQLRRNEALLAQPGPAAAAAAELLRHDPLRLNEFVKCPLRVARRVGPGQVASTATAHRCCPTTAGPC